MKCVCPLVLVLVSLHAASCYVDPPQLDHFIEDVAPGRPLDVVFVIDQSTHLDEAWFYMEGRRLVEAVLEQYVAIHWDYARVAVITFSGDSRVLLDYIKDNTTTATKCDFFDGGEPTPWERVMYIPELESTGGKALAWPLKKARYILAAGRLYRPGVTQVLLLLTDGNYDDKDNAKKEVELLGDVGVTIYTCGTGSPEKHDTRVRILASRDEFYGSYDDWRDMLTIQLTSYKSDTLPLWTCVANDDLCQQPSCVAHSVCQCDILRHVLRCRCDEGYYPHDDGQCTACPEDTYKELPGDHECHFCPPGYVTSTDASTSRDDCYCMTSICVDECGQDDRCPDSHVCLYTGDGLSKCECRKGWNGTDCRTNPDNCVDNDCESGAQCVDMLDSYVCIDLMPSSEDPSPSPTTVTEAPTTKTTSPVSVIPTSSSTVTMSPASVTDAPTSATTGSAAVTTTQGAPTSGSNLGLTVGLAAGVGGIVVVIIIVVVVVIIIKRKSHKRNDAPPESSDQNINSDQRASKTADYDNVYDVIDDNYTGLAERSGSATYTSLMTSTEAGDAPVYLEILPEA